MLEHRVADRAAAARHIVHNSRWNASLLERLDEAKRTQRRQ
jgi:hypothetical protein